MNSERRPSRFVTHEIPTITQPGVLLLLVKVQELRRSVVGLTTESIAQQVPIVRSEQVLPILAILDRLCEASLAAELLLSKGMVRDASVLALSMMELKLDLQYISMDETRLQQWLEHRDPRRRLWKVADQIRTVYSDPREREGWEDLYRRMSMTKHGNPVGESFSFKFARLSDAFLLGDKELDLNLAGPVAYGVGVCLLDAQRAAAVHLGRLGFDCVAADGRLPLLDKELKDALEAEIINLLLSTSTGKQSSQSKAGE